MGSVVVRPATVDDVGFLAEMLAAAADWRAAAPRPAGAVLADPGVAHYLSGWPLPGDVGVVAEEDGEPVGAAWCRRFRAEEPGYGFVAPDVPELSIGVVAGARGRGIGRQVLVALVAELDRLGVSRLSLSVEIDNPAIRLYREVGFVEVARSDGAATMVIDTSWVPPAQ